MESMSQFLNEKELWRERCLRFATAMNAVSAYYDIKELMGGWCGEDAIDRITEAFSDAKQLISEKDKK